MKINTKTVNEIELELNPDDPTEFIQNFIDQYFKPYYKDTNDWNKTLTTSLNEIERICAVYGLSKGDMLNSLLSMVEERLAQDISDMKGVDKIEIIFEGLEDYVKDIQKFVLEGGSQEAKRLKISKLVENLNLFEITELLIHFAEISLNLKDSDD